MTDSLIPTPTFLKPDQPRRTHCACGNKIANPDSDQVAPHMHYVPAYSCSVQCHNDSILGINAFAGRPGSGPVGEGWMPIVLEAHEKFLALDPNYSIAQIKEKFGELRYYFDRSTNAEMRPRVRVTPQESCALSNLLFDLENYWRQQDKEDSDYRHDSWLKKSKYAEDRVIVLRRLLDRTDDKMYQVEKEAERKSRVTCEVCGEPGKLDNLHHWYITLCETHTQLRHDGKTINEIFKSHRGASNE